jgi:hypothetical protein
MALAYLLCVAVSLVVLVVALRRRPALTPLAPAPAPACCGSAQGHGRVPGRNGPEAVQGAVHVGVDAGQA